MRERQERITERVRAASRLGVEAESAVEEKRLAREKVDDGPEMTV